MCYILEVRDKGLNIWPPSPLYWKRQDVDHADWDCQVLGKPVDLLIEGLNCY